MATFKIGDRVQISKSHYSSSWKESYNLQLNTTYEIAKLSGSYFSIKSIDPSSPITYKGAGGPGTIELSLTQLVLDEDFIKKKLEQLFG